MSTIIWCHGGCFGGGNASYDKKVKEFLAKKGYMVVAPEFRKNNKNAALKDVMDICDKHNDIILAGVSSGGFIAHKVANLLNKPAFLICPVFKPYDRHDSLEKKFQKLQLDFFETEEIMKICQDELLPPNNIRQMIFGSSDTRAPVQAMSDWLMNKEVPKQMTVYVLDGTHDELCKNPPLDLVLKCVQECFKIN